MPGDIVLKSRREPAQGNVSPPVTAVDADESSLLGNAASPTGDGQELGEDSGLLAMYDGDELAFEEPEGGDAFGAITAMIADGVDDADAAAIYLLLAAETGSALPELVEYLDELGVMDDVLEGCGSELLWDEDRLDDTFRILEARGDEANLAHLYALTSKKNGKKKRKIDEEDALLASELFDLVQKENKHLKMDESEDAPTHKGRLKDAKKTIKKSTKKMEDDVVPSVRNTAFVGVQTDEEGRSNRERLLASLDEDWLWAAGSEAQLEGTLRMVLAAGHRKHALDVSMERCITEAHQEVLREVGLISEDGSFVENAEGFAGPERGVVGEAIELIRETGDGGHLKIKPIKKRVDAKGLELDEAQDVAGGSMGGIRFAETDGEQDAINMADVLLDLKQGTVRFDAAHLEIEGIDTAKLKSGPMTVLDFHVDGTLPTEKNPDQPLAINVSFDSIEANDLLIIKGEDILSIGWLSVGKTSVAAEVMETLSDEDQSALIAILGETEVPDKVQLSDTFYPSIKGMISEIGDLFREAGTSVGTQMSIDGIEARDITTSGGMYQEQAQLSAIDTEVDLETLGDKAVLLELDIGMEQVSGPLALQNAKLSVLGPSLSISDLSASVSLGLAREEDGKVRPSGVQLHQTSIGSVSGDGMELTLADGTVATFPDLELTDLSASGITLPERGERFDLEALEGAEASLGAFTASARVKDAMTESLVGGGDVALSGLSVGALASGGVSFGLDDLSVEAQQSGAESGPLAKLRALGVQLASGGLEDVSATMTKTEDGGMRIEAAVGDVDTAAELDGPSLGVSGQLGLSGITATTTVDPEGVATLESFQLDLIDASSTAVTLKPEDLRIDLPTAQIRDIHAEGITLPAKGEKFDVNEALAGGGAGIGGIEVQAAVSDTLGESLSAGGTFVLDDLQVEGLESGGIGYSLAELAVVDIDVALADPNSPLAQWVAGGGSVERAGLDDLSGEVHGLGTDQLSVSVDLGALQLAAQLDGTGLGVGGKLSVGEASATVAMDKAAGTATIEQLHLGAIQGTDALLKLKKKGLRLDFPLLSILDVNAENVVLPGNGEELDLATLMPDGSASIGSVDVYGGVAASLKGAMAVGGHFTLDDLSVEGLSSGGVAFSLDELAVEDLDVEASKLGKLGKVGVQVGRIGVDDLHGTLSQNADGGVTTSTTVGRIGVDGVDAQSSKGTAGIGEASVSDVSLDGSFGGEGGTEIDASAGDITLADATVQSGNTSVQADVDGSGSLHLDDESVVIDGTASASVLVHSSGELPGLQSSQVGGREAKPAKNPKFEWHLPFLGALDGHVGLGIPIGDDITELVGPVSKGALDTGAMAEGFAVDAMDYVKARLPDIPRWLRFDIIDEAGEAIEDAIRDTARSVGDGLADQLPAIQPSVEEALNSPKGPKGAKDPLDLSKYIGGLEGADMETQIEGALDVVADDAIAWLGAGSTVVDFAKDDFGTATYNTSKSIWYQYVAPNVQWAVPDAWEDDLKVSDKKISQHADHKKKKDEERAEYVSEVMLELVEGVGDWVGDITMDLDLSGAGGMVANELPSNSRAIDMYTAIGLTGDGSVSDGASLALALRSSGDVSYGNLDASGWFAVSTGVGGQVSDYQGSGGAGLTVDAGGTVTIAR